MKLRDAITIITATRRTDAHGNVTYDWKNPTTVATLPAHVHYATVARLGEPNRDGLVEELRAITKPFDYNPTEQRIQWRDKHYTHDGPPMIRRRNGTDHHLTIPLRLVEG